MISSCLLVLILVFSFDFRLNILDILYNNNLFGYTTLKGVFNVLDEIIHLPSLPHFDYVFRHAQLDHEGQDRVNRLAEDGLVRPTH